MGAGVLRPLVEEDAGQLPVDGGFELDAQFHRDIVVDRDGCRNVGRAEQAHRGLPARNDDQPGIRRSRAAMAVAERIDEGGIADIVRCRRECRGEGSGVVGHRAVRRAGNAAHRKAVAVGVAAAGQKRRCRDGQRRVLGGLEPAYIAGGGRKVSRAARPVEHDVDPVTGIEERTRREIAGRAIDEHAVAGARTGRGDKGADAALAIEIIVVGRKEAVAGIGDDVALARGQRHWGREAGLLPAAGRLAGKGGGAQQGSGRIPQVADMRADIVRVLVEADRADGAARGRLEPKPQFDRVAVVA